MKRKNLFFFIFSPNDEILNSKVTFYRAINIANDFPS